MTPRLSLLPIALLAIVPALAFRAAAQTASHDGPDPMAPLVFSAPASSSLAESGGTLPKTGPGVVRTDITATTRLSYSLRIWGDLFTPEERAVLRSSSQFLNLGRSIERVEHSGPGQIARQEDAGSALAPAISSSLVFFGGQEADPFLAPIILGQPGGSFSRALERQAVPMGSDLAERSRGRGHWDGLSGASLWIGRAVAIVPLPRGSIGRQAGAASLQITTVSLLSGTWPDFSRMDLSGYVHFGEIWLKRTANAALATEFGKVLTPKIASPKSGGRSIALRRPALPVTVFHYSY